LLLCGTRWPSWLRHCATSRKVAGSIPDDVIGILHWQNPSGRTMALGLTQPLTEMSTRNISSRSHWLRGLRHRSAAAGLLRLWVRIPPEAWTFVCCVCCVLSGRGLCDELITRPKEFYRLWCGVVCDPITSCMRRPNQSIITELK
jgi:hypothetical protein